MFTIQIKAVKFMYNMPTYFTHYCIWENKYWKDLITKNINFFNEKETH